MRLLRMHSDITLDILDEVTTIMGERFRRFQRNTCPSYSTRELPREANRRRRRRAKNANTALGADLEPFNKEFSIQTYKHHCLGDYVRTIRMIGTTDSFSTMVVNIIYLSSSFLSFIGTVQGELEHRKPKGRYIRTDRRKNFVKQLTQIERRQARICRIKQNLSTRSHYSEEVSKSPDVHHHIGIHENYYEHIGTFLRTHSADPAVKVVSFILSARILLMQV